jgi:hypothetical protein
MTGTTGLTHPALDKITRITPNTSALTEPVVRNCMRADYSFRRDLSVLPE